jgi:hypothetical protein
VPCSSRCPGVKAGTGFGSVVGSVGCTSNFDPTSTFQASTAALAINDIGIWLSQ